MSGEQPPVELPDDKSVWLCGGCIRSWFTGDEKTKDIDVFAKNQPSLDNFRRLNRIEDSHLSWKHDRADTYRFRDAPIQLIKVFSDDILTTLDKFDYTICQFGYDGEIIYSTVQAVWSVLTKRLSVHQIQTGYELDSIRRAFNYQKRGYEVCSGTILELAKAILNSNPDAITKQNQQLSPSFQRWD